MVLLALNKPTATRVGYLAKDEKSNKTYLLKELNLPHTALCSTVTFLT